MSGRVAIVTGGSGGIGASICTHLLDAGWTVVSMSLAPTDVAHPRLHSVEVDLGDVDATREAARDACARFPVTAIVHNAGAMRPALLPDVTVGDLEALTALHLSAPLVLVQAALPEMRRQRFGRIVLVSSRAALGLATRTAYAATKAGMFGMARTWSLELGRDGVTAIAGFDDGSGTKIHVGGHFTSAGGIPAKNFGVIADRTPPGSRPPTVPSIVAVPVGETYCAGDGSASPCPCLNHGAPAHGCRSAAFASGARLDADGVSALSSDSLVLRTTATPSGQFAVFLQGDRRANGGLGLASFDGLACLDGSLVRLGTKFSAGASAVFPQATDRPISIVGGVPVAGAVRHYQVQYRETNALYCSPEPVNWTNALTVVWRP